MKLPKIFVVVLSSCMIMEINSKGISPGNVTKRSFGVSSSTPEDLQDQEAIRRVGQVVQKLEGELEKIEEKIVNIFVRLEDLDEKINGIYDKIVNEKMSDALSSSLSVNTRLHLWEQKIDGLDYKIDKLINQNDKKFDDSSQQPINQPPLQLKLIEDVLPLDLAIISLQTRESIEKVGEKIQQNLSENGEKLDSLKRYLQVVFDENVNKNVSRADEISMPIRRKERRISNHSSLITDILGMVRERLKTGEADDTAELVGSLTDIVASFENMTSAPKIKSSAARKDGLIFPNVKNKPSKLNTPFVSDAKDGKGFSCVELMNAGMRQSGVYYLQIRGTTYWFLNVYCEQEIADGGWTVIQRRDDFGEPRENFNRDWADYKNGFGDPAKEFWMGNENIYMLTNNEDYAIRIELEDFEGNKRYAQYSHFKIHSEADYYKLEIDGYEGNAGDSLNDLTYGSNNSPFSTYNRDNDRSSLNCASMLKGGWWWKSCGRGLNGLYLQHPHDIASKLGIIWFQWKGWDYTLKKSTMMIRPLPKQTAS